MNIGDGFKFGCGWFLASLFITAVIIIVLIVIASSLW